jgi:hypothetical protein
MSVKLVGKQLKLQYLLNYMNNLLMALSLLEQKQLQYKQAGYTLSFE